MSLYAKSIGSGLAGSGGGTTPGGTDGEIQYNDNGVLAGDTSTTDGAGNVILTSIVASGDVKAASVTTDLVKSVYGDQLVVQTPNGDMVSNDPGILVQTGSQSDHNSGPVSITTGIASSNDSGDVTISTGLAGFKTGDIILQPGDTFGGTKGQIKLNGTVEVLTTDLIKSTQDAELLIKTPDGAISSDPGIRVKTGDQNPGTNSGPVTLKTGDTIFASSGDITIATGMGTIGDSGDVVIQTGTSDSTRGEVQLNASAYGKTQTGLLGVGRSPSYQLDVQTTAGRLFVQPNPRDSTGVSINSVDAANTQDESIEIKANNIYLNGATGYVKAGNEVDTAELFIPTGTGHVGINNESPAHALDVNGETNLDGAVILPTLTAYAALVLDSSKNIASIAPGTIGNVMVSDGTGWTSGPNTPVAGNLTGPVTSVGLATSITNLAITNAMIAASTINLTTKVTGILPIANGGTGVNAVTTTPTASAFAAWDANSNMFANHFFDGFLSTAASAGTLTLTAASPKIHRITLSSSTHTVVMPAGTDVPIGSEYTFYVASGVTVTFNSITPTLISTVVGPGRITLMSTIGTGGGGYNNIDVVRGISLGGTGATTKAAGFDALSPMTASGDIIYGGTSGTGTALAKGSNGQVLKLASGLPAWSSFTAPTQSIATLTSHTGGMSANTTGTYTTPANVLYIKVRMVGGGGGGGGGGTAAGANGGTGGNSTFGTTLLVANGGTGGTKGQSGSVPAAGGTASLGTGPTGTAVTGGSGGNACYVIGSAFSAGGDGAASPFGGAGGGTVNTGSTGGTASTNSGSGGGGGGTGNNVNTQGGAGGGAGGFVDALIASPSATYSYTVGAAGAVGSAGTNGSDGGLGGSGYIEVTEYYQ